jgi:hypothetical protein
MSGKHYIRLGARRIPLPGSAALRIAIGGLLILGGCLGFLPVLGFWMVPLGLVVLSIDLPIARRLRRRAEVRLVPPVRRLRQWWNRRKAPKEK